MLDAAQAAVTHGVACAASRSVLPGILPTPSGVIPVNFWVPTKCLVAEQASASSVISLQVVISLTS